MDCKFVSGKSGKTGNVWYAVDVYLTDTYKKRCFLTSAEVELYKLNSAGDDDYGDK